MKYLITSLLTLLCLGIAIFFFHPNEKVKYEINSFTYNVIEYEDILQFDIHLDITNSSDKPLYVTLDFPSYILTNLRTAQAPLKLNPHGTSMSSAIISVKKDGAEMSKETLKALLDKDLPLLNGLLIGESVHLSEIP